MLDAMDGGVGIDAKRRRIGLREVRALGPGEIVWDATVTGLCARRQQGEAVSYSIFYRTLMGRQRWYRIGRHGSPWTPEEARTEALRVLGEVARGGDPAGDRRARREGCALTVSVLCDRYLADAETGRLLTRRRVAKKASTISTDRRRIEAHIRPLIGSLSLAAVTRDDVERLLQDISTGVTRKRVKLDKRHALSIVRGGLGAASRTVGLLGAMMTYAVSRGLRLDNPVVGVMRPADRRRDRRLSRDEYAALGAGLIAATDDEV